MADMRMNLKMAVDRELRNLGFVRVGLGGSKNG